MLAALAVAWVVSLGFNVTSAGATGGRGDGGCAGAGGGGTGGIGAQLGCGLPPPAALAPQDNGPGVFGPPTGPPLGSPCLETELIPSGTGNPGGAPSHEYVSLTPAVNGNPETGLTATATIHSPLPIGSPTGPSDVTVPPEHVETAAQLNADAAAEAKGIADQFNTYQQQQIDEAASANAFDHPSAAIEALLTTAPYTAADFYMPLGPPIAGMQAASQDATTWTLRELVYLHVGRVVHDQVTTGAGGVPVYGPEYCSGLTVAGTDSPFLQSHMSTTVPTFTTQVNSIADALWHSFRRGSIVSEPANGSPTYVGVPTCVGLNTGLPTGSGTPNPFTLTLPLSLKGVAGALPVTVAGRIAVSIVADGVHWDFHDPAGDVSVYGQGSSDPSPPTGTPTFDAASGTWLNADQVCTVYHQYRGLAAAPGVMVSATEHFHIEVSGVYSTGSAAPVSFAYRYEPPDSPVVWTSGPYPVYQIEAVPYAPAG